MPVRGDPRTLPLGAAEVEFARPRSPPTEDEGNNRPLRTPYRCAVSLRLQRVCDLAERPDSTKVE